MFSEASKLAVTASQAALIINHFSCGTYFAVYLHVLCGLTIHEFQVGSPYRKCVDLCSFLS